MNDVLRKLFFTITSFTWVTFAGMAQNQPQWGAWEHWGDQKNGTYRNPIIPSDYSDLDCIRVGETYYAISSTFQFSPGMIILESKDLVNWKICGHAVSDLTQISDELSWQKMNRYGKGIWAGSLRHHNNRFYLYFGTPDEGYFMTSAAKAEGPWEPLTPLLKQPGWDDCSVIWDEQGKGYFIGTHFADGYKTYLFNMSADGKSIDRQSAILVNAGSGREASKLLKVKDWYYLIFSEHKPDKGRYVMAKRSRTITGPYAEEKQLALTSQEAMEPNQGGIIPGKDGKWYFLTHHGTGDWSGRIVSLLPVTWINDWPIIGTVLGDSIGTMTWEGKIPSANAGGYSLARSDEFNTPVIVQQWEWNYQPRNEKYSLRERKGWLRLEAFKPLKNNELLTAGNTLTQRCFRTRSNEVIVKLDITRMASGQRSGLCHFSQQQAAIGIAQEGSTRWIEYRKNGTVMKGDTLTGYSIWLRSVWGLDGKSTFSYSLDGKKYTSLGEPYTLAWGYYRGDRIGLYSFNNEAEKGSVDIDYFHYTIEK
ncbi:glycoside hydrolase 43 family protein [Siphonobacter sp. SORGH_AS_1065]|uniref:glycoside hydrolase family 43 protein n=1 Tax=Siphonobacter sp. SORGH_AS_1065 TaxID=3041795 RepID=UPI00278009B2|nr:glycoside hydrolase 43 family protein [Siphonobacter sp. SORGH_AS_1065]MDQ1090081.1 beta-xylosidase [Siphonobacter sp. SORGH_AS_1065]